MRAGVIAAHRPLGVKPIGLGPLEIRGVSPGQGLWSPARGLICRALTRGRDRCRSGDLDPCCPTAGQIFLRLNLLLLLGVAFLPFPTRLMADALYDISGELV